MTLATMPGQTNFIAQFNASLRADFGLSHGAFGGFYTLATLASASVLVFAGVLADKVAARLLAIGSIVGLAVTALVMSGLQHVALLVVALAALRFFRTGDARAYRHDDHGALVQPVPRPRPLKRWDDAETYYLERFHPESHADIVLPGQ